MPEPKAVNAIIVKYLEPICDYALQRFPYFRTVHVTSTIEIIEGDIVKLHDLVRLPLYTI